VLTESGATLEQRRYAAVAALLSATPIQAVALVREQLGRSLRRFSPHLL